MYGPPSRVLSNILKVETVTNVILLILFYGFGTRSLILGEHRIGKDVR